MNKKLNPLLEGKIAQTKYMSVTLDIGALAVAGIKASASADLDTNYDVCDGVGFVENTDGGIPNGDYDVKIETGNGTPIEQTPIDLVQVDKTSGDPNDRYVDTLFEVRSGKDAKLIAVLPVAAVGAMRIKATFRLRKLLTPISLPKV